MDLGDDGFVVHVMSLQPQLGASGKLLRATWCAKSWTPFAGV